MRYNKKLFLAFIFFVSCQSILNSQEHINFALAKSKILDREDCNTVWRFLWNHASAGSAEAFWELHNGFLNGLMPPNYDRIDNALSEYADYIFVYGSEFGMKNKTIIVSSNVKKEFRLAIKRLSKNQSDSTCARIENEDIYRQGCVNKLSSKKIILSKSQFTKKFNKYFGFDNPAVCTSTIPGL